MNLVELFVKHPRGLEALRNPEVHLAQLEQGGWGYATPFQRAPPLRRILLHAGTLALQQDCSLSAGNSVARRAK
jgi:hypothetical protein